ncbi:MAG: crosslink repair DNA glycosylase YcaQ family protein [Prevotella sp.]
MNPIAIRLLSQQLICPQFDTPQKVVSHFGAMQAQDYRMVRWAVMMRTRKPSSFAFKNAYDEGEIVRLHLLRGTWQLVSNEDYWWMLDLISPKATSVVKGWMKSNKISIDDSEFNLIHEIFVQKTDEMQSVTSKDLNEALLEKGIIMDKHRLSDASGKKIFSEPFASHIRRLCLVVRTEHF